MQRKRNYNSDHTTQKRQLSLKGGSTAQLISQSLATDSAEQGDKLDEKCPRDILERGFTRRGK